MAMINASLIPSLVIGGALLVVIIALLYLWAKSNKKPEETSNQ